MDWKSGVVVATVVCTSLGCTGVSELDNLRTRAAFELNCSKSQIRIVNLDDTNEAYGVSGCGTRAVYLWHCSDAYDLDCKWVRND